MKTFNVELYIQALTTDLNCLERQKNEDNKVKATEASQRLADGFLRLADVLDEHINVCRECVLTSFSLKPTKECLQRIEDMARRCGFEVLDTGQWKCKMHPPVLPSDDLCTQCSECGDFMSQMQLEAAINTNVALNEALTAERLELSPELCDDLVVVVCSSRYQLLSWLQNWPELHRLCIMYLNDPERTKNLVTELKFLDIDYSIFMNIKREPEEEEQEETCSYGYDDIMEKEFYSDPHLNVNKKPRKKPSRKKLVKAMEESPLDVFVPPRASTDPNVLKTLRSFRRNLKRPRDGDNETVHPGKLFISNDICTSTPQESHSNAIPSLAQSPVSGYYPSVNFDYYGNVNNSANNGYLNSYDYNGYYYPYYYNSELGNTNNSYNYGYKCSQNFSDLNSVDYKIKLNTKPQITNKDNSTIVKEDCSGNLNLSTTREETSDLPKDCSLTYPKDCSKLNNSVNKEESVLKKMLNSDVCSFSTESSICTTTNSQTNQISVEKLSKSLTERLLTSLTNDLRQEKLEKDRILSTKKLIQLKKTLNLPETVVNDIDNTRKFATKQLNAERSTNLHVTANDAAKKRPRSELESTGMKPENHTMSKTQLELHNMLKARLAKNAQLQMRSTYKQMNDKSSSSQTFLDRSTESGTVSNVDHILNNRLKTFSFTKNEHGSNFKNKLPKGDEANSSNVGKSVQVSNNNSNLNQHTERNNSGLTNSQLTEQNIRMPVDSNTGYGTLTGNEMTNIYNQISQNDLNISNILSGTPKRTRNDCEDIFSEPPIEPNERISYTDEKVPPWEEISMKASKNQSFDPSDEVNNGTFYTQSHAKLNESHYATSDNAVNYIGSGNSTPERNKGLNNFLGNEDLKASDGFDTTSFESDLSSNSETKNSFDTNNFSYSKNLNDTCSHTEIEDVDNYSSSSNEDESSDSKKDQQCDESCAFDMLIKLQNNMNATENIFIEDFLLDRENNEGGSDTVIKCSLCGESDWDDLKALVNTSPITGKKRCKIDNIKLFKVLYRKLEDKHKSNVKFKTINQPKITDENDISISLIEKYKLKELKVVLSRFNVQPVSNKLIVAKSKDADLQKKTDVKVQLLNNKNKQKLKKSSRKSNKRSENKSKVQSPNHNKDEYKSRSWPLQDMNPRVVCDKAKTDLLVEKYDKIDKPEKQVKPKSDKDLKGDKNEDKSDDIYRKSDSIEEMINKSPDNEERIPRVMLKRLDVHAILANVPGLHDTEMIRPTNVDSIVQVVQVAGGRPTASTPNNQTSTQVTPHIQRIGQPRIDKPDPTVVAESSSSSTNTKSSTTAVTAKPVTSQPSTLINILSQQIIRPGQSNSRPRTGPFINILSQQIVRPANSSAAVKTIDTQANSSTTRIVSTGEPQVINQLVNPIRTSGTTLKTVVTNPGTDQSRIVQLICKSADGKLIPVTSFTPNRVVKVATTQTVTSSSPSSPNFEESLTKLVQVSPKVKNDTVESPETLPKFQQAFGKTVYQNNVDSTNTTATNNIVNNVDVDKIKNQTKISSSVNVQPIQGGVIYTRQVPVGQTINLIPPNRGQVFRIATSNADQISLVKDTTVIHNKMSALLAAALQGKQKNSEVIEVDSSAETNTSQTSTRVALTRPTLVHNTRIVKPVLQIPSNVIRNAPQPNLSSTTLEQLREFDMVYKQVKERSSTTTPSDSSITSESTEASQRISVTYLNQPPKINCSPVVVVSSYNSLQPAASPALSVASQGSSSPCVTPAPTPTPVLPKVASKGSKGKSVKNATLHTSKASPVPKPQQKPQEDEHTTQRIFDILAEYAEQLRNSPDLNNKPAPRRRSNPPTNPSQNSKRKKSSSSKKSGQCSSTLTSEADLEDPRTIGSEDSSCGVVQVSMHEDDSTPVTINASESNDATVQPRQQLILTESTTNQTRNLIIADSSVGEALKMPNTAVLVPGNYIMPVSMVKGGQQIAVVSGGSKILATVPARSGPNMLLFQSFLNQNRKTVPTVKYSAIQPIAGISSQSITGVASQQPVILQQPASHGISTVTLSQPLPIKKLDEPDRINTELLLTISQARENDSSPSEEVPQPDSSTSVVSTNIESIDLEESATLSDTSSEKTYTYEKPLVATPIATPVIAQTNTKDELNINSTKVTESGKVEERVQSVLVTAGTSNGPMLSHSPPRFTKQNDCAGPTEQNKDDFLRNGGKRSSGTETKNFQTNNLYTIHGKIKKVQANSQKIDRELQQLCLQRKQAALERELRLQKSLSEECEDLGVDEPSTSDLFPEADLLFDSNHSPSFDQSSQDIVKRPIHCQENKEESKLTLFSDDDFLFEPGEYQTAETELEYDEQSRLLTNGQSSTSTESGSPCGDNTLLQTCTSMSDVTLNSPISPDTYHATTPPPLNKYVHKYSNRKKDRLKQVENWPADVSSSEDTTGSTELIKSSSPELCTNKRSDEELSESSFKVVRVAISKTECDEIHCSEDADCSISGRGARRSVKKMCSCCNGSQDAAASRKRPTSQPHTPTPHKKTLLSKRR